MDTIHEQLVSMEESQNKKIGTLDGLYKTMIWVVGLVGVAISIAIILR